ncbi:hypothetical protein GCM10009560_11840 [Nonomuraea longicatena]|uniref:Uncharacterized protein n=1 Tax=Nonomuraea longicatena TaxID=83682 RepID=A0ABP3Z7Q1_9ACTN
MRGGVVERRQARGSVRRPSLLAGRPSLRAGRPIPRNRRPRNRWPFVGGPFPGRGWLFSEAEGAPIADRRPIAENRRSFPEPWRCRSLPEDGGSLSEGGGGSEGGRRNRGLRAAPVEVGKPG